MPRTFLPRLTALAAASLLATGASAFEIDAGDSGFKVRLDTTVRYSGGVRLKEQAPELSTLGPVTTNQNDGNNNFKKGGLYSNRLDLLTEFDVVGPSYGLRVSAAAWYDAVYNGNTDNTTATSNHRPANEFPSETRRIMGRDAEVLDAFVFGNFQLGDRAASVRFGRHTLLWGESLFFGGNAIAGGQAPTDLIKLLSVPNSQTKETALPTAKLSGSAQLTDALTLGAYVGLEWKPTRLLPVGAYLNASDTLGPEGGERILAGPTAQFVRSPELKPGNSGQGGLQLRYRADSLDTDFGFYAIRFHAFTPSNILTTLTGAPPATVPSTYQWIYHEGIKAFGVSAAKTVGAWSLGTEVSYRQNAPLASLGQAVIPAINLNTTLDNKKNPGYAVGETLHAQVSWLASLGPFPFAQEVSFLGEVAWNRRLKVTQNPAMLNPLADRDAASIRMVLSPTFRQVLPGLDLSVPMGASYTSGRSSALGPAFGSHKGGDFNVGLAGTYLSKYFFNLNYVNFYGPAGTPANAANQAQFKQALADRDYVSFSLRTTF
jgi:Protein of unknown function (DUF1302)